jgi:hypothetical protein
MTELLIPMLMNIHTLRQVVSCCIAADVSVKSSAPVLRLKQSEKMEGP